MPKEWAQLETALTKIKLEDKELVLKTMGGVVVKEIIAMIDREEQPDGSPQRQNKPYTRLEKQLIKGYTTPLKGAHPESPYLARHSQVAWRKTFKEPDSLIIELNPKRQQIGIKLQLMGYWFMGITKEAEIRIRQIAIRWFRNKWYKATGHGFD